MISQMRGPRQLRIYVLIDALGWRVLQGRDFLQDILTYRQPVRTVLGFSSGAIPTMLTGLTPAKTGHWNLLYYDPQGSPFRWLRFFGFLPDRVLDNRVSRKLLKEAGRHVLGMGPLFECCVSPRLLPYFNWTEKRSIYASGGIPGTRSIFDDLEERRIPYKVYSYHHWTDSEIFGRAFEDLKNGTKFSFLYLSELDALLHQHPDGGEELDRRLEWYADQLRKLFEAARQIDAETALTVLSDHGMAPVRERFDLVGEIESLGFRMPKDYLAVYDSTMARFWFFSEEARRAVLAGMRELSCAHVMTDEELEDLGILFEDRRHGETIVLMQPGWLLSRSHFNGTGWNPSGMHGYHPDDPDSDAVYLSNRRPPVAVRTIADVYQCMREALQ